MPLKYFVSSIVYSLTQYLLNYAHDVGIEYMHVCLASFANIFLHIWQAILHLQRKYSCQICYYRGKATSYSKEESFVSYSAATRTSLNFYQ